MPTFKKTELKLFLTVFLVSTIFIHWMGFNENTKLDFARAVIEEGRLEIDTFANNTADRSYINGHYYTDKAPGSAWLIVPVYGSWRLLNYNFVSDNNFKLDYSITTQNNVNFFEHINSGKFILSSYILITVSTSVLFTSLTVVLIYKFSSHFLEKEWQRIFVSLAYWLGTLAFFYTMVFFNYAFATFLAFLSFFLLFLAKSDNRKFFLILTSGILMGLAILSEYPAVILFIPFFLYAWHITGKSKGLLFLIAVLVGVSPLMIQNYTIFGDPLKLTLENIDPVVWGGSGLTNKLGLNSNPNLFVIIRLLFYPEKGLFFYFPFMALSIIGVYLMLKKYIAEGLLILAVFILILILISTYKAWWGHSSFGPRRIFLITPFLMLPIIFTLRELRIVFILILLVPSIFFNLAGLEDLESKDVFTLTGSYEENQKTINIVNTLEIINNPLINHHLPLFIENGPRSRLIERMFNEKRILDIRDHPFVDKGILDKNSIKLSSLPSLGYLVIKLSLIKVMTVLAFVLMIWYEKICKKRWCYVLIILILLISIALFVRIQKIVYEESWYAVEMDNIGKFRWMADNATVSVYSINGLRKNIELEIRSYFKNRTLKIQVNDNLVETLEATPSWRNITIQAELKSGDNKILLDSVEGCDVPAEVENSIEKRCLSFAIRDIKI